LLLNEKYDIMPSVSPLDVPAFAASQLILLDEELQAEVAETSALIAQTSPTSLQRAGVAIINLNVSSQRTGLGGKTIVDLELDSALGSGELPENDIRTGDIVRIQEQPSGSAKKNEKAKLKARGASGVVIKVTGSSVSVALDNEDDDVPESKLWV
jgi:DNA polymerase alpha-associated DNA helicase A